MSVSFTTDFWSASNGDAFLSLTCHFIDANFVLMSFLLGNLKFILLFKDSINAEESHTAEYCAQLIR